MKMSELTKRILTCSLGIPLLACLIFVFPGKNHLAFAVFTIIVTLSASIETGKMMFGKITAIPCISWISLLVEFAGYRSFHFFILLIILCFAAQIKKGEKYGFSGSSEMISKNILCAVYPSSLMVYIMRILILEKTNSFTILLFLLLVFSNDIFAYVFGKLFGKNNSGIFKVSPNKSIAGFAGGFVCCTVVCVMMFSCCKRYLPDCSLFIQIVLGASVAILSDIGDLAESVLKRSAGVKDSSDIVPGRGGVLDGIDSICVSAPFFYAIIRLL